MGADAYIEGDEYYFDIHCYVCGKPLPPAGSKIDLDPHRACRGVKAMPGELAVSIEHPGIRVR